MDEWLGSYDTRAVMISQSGALADDEQLDELRTMIYSERGRSEAEDIGD